MKALTLTLTLTLTRTLTRGVACFFAAPFSPLNFSLDGSNLEMADVDDLEINLDDLIGGDDASGAPSQQPALGPAAALSAASSTSKQAVMFAQAAAPGGTSLGAHAAGGFDEAGGTAELGFPPPDLL